MSKKPRRKRLTLPNRPFISLGSKFILLVVIILLITMSVATFINVTMQKRILVDQLTEKGHAMGSFISLISADAILGYDFVLLDRYMEEIAQQKDVVYGVIVSPEEFVLSSYINNRHQSILHNSDHPVTSVLDIIDNLNGRDDILPLNFRITNADEIIGYVRIGLSTLQADQLSQRILHEHVLEILIIIVFLSLSINYLFRRSALLPIQNLIISAEHLAEGKALHRTPINSHDELGRLAHAFNHMADSLHASQQEKDKVLQQLITANKELEMATRAKSAFLANMSHEIRTPLTAILGFGEYLRESDLSPIARDKAINSIVHNGQHLLHIINDILDLSKVEAEKLELDRQDVSLFEIIQQVEALLSIQTRERGLAYHIEYVFPLPARLTTDPLRFKQILINICNNAVKFTETGSIDLRISYQNVNNSLRVDVQDTGIGIEENQLDRIFETFTQASSNSNRPYGGTGLGLPLSRDLANMLGGDVEVHSEPGEGSCFSVYIDAGEAAGDSLVDQLPERLHIDTGKHFAGPLHTRLSGRVLLAEDVIDNQRLISLYVSKTGAQIEVVSNGQQAVDRALADSFDLILMDVHMPVMDGIEAVKSLRSQGYQGPITALTANAMKADRDACIGAGFDDFLAKPIDRNLFNEMLAKYLAASQADACEPLLSDIEDEDSDFDEIIYLFIERLPAMLDNINQAYQQQQWNELSGFVHEVKGISGSLGFPDLMKQAVSIEKDLKAEQHEQLDEKISQLNGLVQRIVAAKSHYAPSEMASS